MTDLSDELAALNKAVDDAIARRTAWMDKHMPAFASCKIGEEIFNRKTGQRLGVISRMYRYWGPFSGGEPRDVRFDRSMSVEYEFETSPRCFDNTSRFGGSLSICNREELARSREAEAEALRSKVD